MLDIQIKVVLLGHSCAGKTSLVQRLISNKYTDKYNETLGYMFCSKLYVLRTSWKVHLGIWDTNGQDRYESVNSDYYADANAIIICYDVTSLESWRRARQYVHEIQQTRENIPLYMCATKTDLAQRVVAPEAVPVYKYGRKIKGHFETSSKNNENIDDLFSFIVQDYIQKHKFRLQEEEKQLAILNSSNPSEKCCTCLPTFCKNSLS